MYSLDVFKETFLGPRTPLGWFLLGLGIIGLGACSSKDVQVRTAFYALLIKVFFHSTGHILICLIANVFHAVFPGDLYDC